MFRASLTRLAAQQLSGQDPNELFRVCNSPEAVASGSAVVTEVLKERWKVHRDGDWHRSVHVWTVGANAAGWTDVLLQKRSELKDTNPGKLDVSCAGHVEAADTVARTVTKELREELGMADVSSFGVLKEAFVLATPFKTGRPVNDNEWQYVFILRKHPHLPPLAATDFTANPAEVADLVIVRDADLKHALLLRDPQYVSRRHEYIDALFRHIASAWAAV